MSVTVEWISDYLHNGILHWNEIDMLRLCAMTFVNFMDIMLNKRSMTQNNTYIL